MNEKRRDIRGAEITPATICRRDDMDIKIQQNIR